MIQRDGYLNKLITRIDNGLIKVITGMRRVGKSYLMNEIFYNYLIENITTPNHIIRFSFDSAVDLEKIGEDLFDISKNKRKVDYKKFIDYISNITNSKDKYYLLLDEVQLLDSFEYVLNGYLSKKNYDIYVTGSNSKFLSSDIITEFRGRGDEIHVMPLSFKEYFDYSKLDFDSAINIYMVYGGLPQVVLAKTDEAKSRYLDMQLKNTYLRDIIERNNIKNEEGLNMLLSILSSNISCLINPKKLSNTFKSESNLKLSEDTIKKFIDYFNEAFILRKSLRYDVKGNSYILTPYKIYFEDLGIRNANINFRQIENTHLMENLIYNELIYRGYSVDVGAVEVRENMNRKMLEVDFLVNKGSNRYYIQSAYSIPDDEKMKQELRPLDSTNDSFKKIVIVRDNIVKRYNEKGYLFISLKDFLLDEYEIM